MEGLEKVARKSGRKLKTFMLLGCLLVAGIFGYSFIPTPSLIAQNQEEPIKVVFDEPLILHFSQPMNQKSVQKAFNIAPKMVGHVEWIDRKTLAFHPENPLPLGAEYRVTLKSSAQNVWLKETGQESFQDFIVTGPPQVIFQDPSPEGVLSKNQPLTVMFDRPMAFDQISLQDILKTEPPLKGEIKTVGQTAFQFFPESLSPKITYQINLPAGLPALDGGKTREDMSWQVQSSSGNVIKTLPAENEVIDLNQAIEIHFDQPVDLGLIQPGTNAQLFPSNDLEEVREDGFFNTEVRYGEGEQGQKLDDVLIFTPTFPFKTGQKYQFVLKNDGQLPLMQDFILHFQTSDDTSEENESNLHQEVQLMLNQTHVKPGETVKLQGIWRKVQGENLILPQASEVRVQLLNSTSQSVLQKVVPVQSGGMFSAEFKLPADLSGGCCELLVTDSNDQPLAKSINLQFQEVTSAISFEWLQSPEDEEKGVFIVEARRENGFPVAQLQAEALLYQKPLSHSPYSEQGYVFGAKSCELHCDEWKEIYKNILSFDAAGRAEIKLDETIKKELQTNNEYVWVIKSLDQKTASTGLYPFNYQRQPLLLGLNVETSSYQNIQTQVIALSNEGQIVEGQSISAFLLDSEDPSKILYEKEFISADGPVALNVPLSPEMGSNSYLLRLEAQDSEGKLIRTEKEIDPSGNDLVVSSDEEKTIYTELSWEPTHPKPGEEISLKVKTTDSQGQPLPATVILNAIQGDVSPFQFSSSKFFLPQSATEPPSYSTEAHSFYFDTLQTNEEGVGSIRIKLPTEGNIHLQGLANAGEAFGFTQRQLKLNDILHIQPLLPNALVPGDKTVFSALVRNNSSGTYQTQLKLKTDHISSNPLEQTLILEPGQQKQVVFEVEIDPNTEAEELTVAFSTKDDSVERRLPILQMKQIKPLVRAKLKESTASYQVKAQDSFDFKKGQVEWDLALTPKALLTTWQKVIEEFSMDSTYEMASLLMADMLRENVDKAKLQESVEQLQKEIKPSGGYAWWASAQEDPALTAMVVAALAQAEEKGLFVDQAALQKTLTYSLTTLSIPQVSLSDQAFILWALAEHQQYDTERTLKLLKKLPPNNFIAKAFTLMTLDRLYEAGQTTVGPFVDRLKKDFADNLRQNKTGSFFQGASDSKTLSTATVLYALAKLDHRNPILPEMVNYLLSPDHDENEVKNPREVVWTLMALAEFMKGLEASEKATLDLELNGHPLFEGELNATASQAEQITELSKTFDSEGMMNLEVQKQTEETVYLNGFWKGYLRPETLKSIEKKAVLVQDIYLSDDPQKNSVSTLQNGQAYQARLQLIVSQDLSGVVLDIPNFAGVLMKLNTALSPFEKVETTKQGLRYLASHLPAGVYEVTIDLQPVLPGEYQQLPATLTALMDPGVYARTEMAKVKILK